MSDPDLERVERRLTWIVGSPRSGSTWLLRLLCHPWGVGRTPTGIDRSRWRGDGPAVAPVNESYLPQHLAPLRESLPSDAPADGPVLINDLRGSDPAYFFSSAQRSDWFEPTRRMVLERFGAQAERARTEHGMDRDPLILIKEPNGSHAAEQIAELLPASRMIFLLRDGRDVVDSMLDADSPGGWRTRVEGVEELRSPEQRLAAVRRQAQLWLIRTIAVERACRRLGPEQTLTVRYEDLLEDTTGELARLDRWLGLDREQRQIAGAARAHRFGSLRNRLRGRRKGIRAASPGLWRENLTIGEQAAVEDLIGSKLSELGYQA